MAGIVFHGLPYKLSDVSGRLERPLANFLDRGRRFRREIASVRPKENIDIATTIVPQNRGIRLILSYNTL